MIHLVIAESKKGYDWFERKNDHLFAHSGSCCDYIDLTESNLKICFRGSNDPNVKNNLQYILYYPEISGSIPRTEKELNLILNKEFQTLLDLSKDKILYIFTTSEQVFHFFRIRVAKQEMKCEDLKVSFIEEFFYDLGDGEKDDFNEIKMIILPGGYFDGWSNKMFGQTTHDLGELLRARRATIVPAGTTEKSSTAP